MWRKVFDFFLGLLYAVAVVGIVLGLMTLQGCASGVQMTDEERIACRDNGCSVWTEQELRGLVNRAGKAGYDYGWRDATVQGGRGL